MVGYKYSILEAKTQADIDRRTNDQEQAGYRLASFFITDQGHLRGEAVYRGVTEHGATTWLEEMRGELALAYSTQVPSA